MLRTHSHWPHESQSWGWMFQQEKWDGKSAVLALSQLLCLPWCSVLTRLQKEHLAGRGKCGCMQSSWTKDAAFAWSQKSFHCLKSEFSSVQSLSFVRLWDPMTAARQVSLSITNSWSLLKFMSIELVMSFNHIILCHPLLPPSIFPSIRVFSSESVLCIRWPKYWSFNFSISPSNEYSGLISFRIDWLDLLAQSKGLSRVFSNTTVQKHQFFGPQLSL